MCNIVFLYNYTVYLLYEKSGDGYVFYCMSKQAEKMSNQLQIESYRISMRKLRTFYRKVTEFLNDDKMAYLHRLGVIVIINVY